MITITSTVEEILLSDEVALEAVRAGILNLSAYADKIHSDLEKRTLKKVKKGSVVVALHRLTSNLPHVAPLIAPVSILDLSIQSPLCELTFDRTAQTLEKVAQLPSSVREDSFFTITEGLREITLVCSSTVKDSILQLFRVPPKGVYDHLVAVTLHFDEALYLEQPNMIFTLLQPLARKRINLIEIVSTFTEISFIVRKAELEPTVDALRSFFREA